MEGAIKYRDINIPIADASKSYRCYLSVQFFEVPCPECGGLLAQKYSVGLMYIRTEHYETDSFILLDRYSYFCTRCPVIVVDARIPKKLILDGINGENVIDNSFKGLINLDAIPENKRDFDQLDTSIIPITLVPFLPKLQNRIPLKNDLPDKQQKDGIMQLKLPLRNDPCFCGSGKKYKNCHAKLPGT